MASLKQKITALSPPGLLNTYLQLKRQFRKKKIERTEVVERANINNVFHCCPQKTASQWLKAVFEDPLVYKYSGLFPYNFTDYAKAINLKDPTYYHFPKAFPDQTLATPLYVTYDQFLSIPKPENYRAFFVIRDPRDLVVSQYFSILYSHKRSDEVDQKRQTLRQMTQKEGLQYVIEHLADNGYWDRIRSWGNIDDSYVTVIRYEDLANEQTMFATFRHLMDFCQLPIPDDVLREVLTNKSFEKLNEGRHQGQENKNSHYRKGVPGDWKNYFDEDLKLEFDRIAGDIVTIYSYR